MKIKFTKFTKAMLFCFVISLSSCEKDLYENLTNTNTESLAFSTKIVALKDIPDVELFINNKVGDIASKSKTGKSTSSLSKITFDINKIIEVTDTIKNKNYSIRFVFDDTPENVFFNLIINVLSTGEKVPFVEKYTCAISNFTTYKNSQYNFNNFQGTVELFKANVFFGKTAILGKKSGDDPCLPKFYPNGDPIPQVSSFVYAGGSTSGSGGTSSTGTTTTTTGSYPNVATGGQGIFVTGTSSSGTSTSGGSTGCCSCGNCGTHWYMPTRQKDHVQMKTAADPCPDIVPIGYIGVSAEPEKLQMLRAELQISLQQWQWLHGKDELMDLILTYIHSSKDVNSAKENSLLAIEFCTNKTKTEYLFAIEAMNTVMNGIEVDSGVSDFVDEQPVKIYMGTVSDFKSLLDNSPRGVGKFKGSEAGNYLKSLGETKFNFKQMRPLPTQTGFFNTKKSRYIYTNKGGWIDMAHFMFYAGKAYEYKINNVTNPIGEAVQDGYKQEASDGIVAKHLAYSYEDLPSDKFGAEFAVNFFDIYSSLTFSEQLANYLNNILKASSPNDAPNFNETPDLDSKDTRPITNTTTTPIYTK